MHRASDSAAREYKKYSFILKIMATLVVTILAAGSWMAGWFLVSSAMAVLATCAIIWHTGSRQAQGALNYRASLLRSSSLGSQPSLFLTASSAGTNVSPEGLPELHESSQGLQIELTDARRAAVSRFASRRLLARRRPIPGSRRENLARWKQR